MKAIALRPGYYINRIVEEDEVFDVVEPLTKGTWFRVLDEPKEAKSEKGPRGKKDDADLA